MKLSVLTAVVVLASSSAIAGSNTNSNQNTNSNINVNQNSNTNANLNANKSVATNTGKTSVPPKTTPPKVGGGTKVPTPAKAPTVNKTTNTTNTVNSSNSLNNTSKQYQNAVTTSTSASQSGAESGSESGAQSSSDNEGNNQRTVYNSSTNIPRQTPMAISGDVQPTASCRNARNGGASSPVAGLSFGFSTKDDECDLREVARLFFEMGRPDLGINLLCTSKAAKRLEVCAALVPPPAYVYPPGERDRRIQEHGGPNFSK